MQSPREVALQILYDIEKNGAYLNISFQSRGEKSGLSGRDAAFVKELTYGVMQRKLTLDKVIAQFSSVKLRKLAPYVLCILRMGLYQLFYMDKIPQSAAVNESVHLAGKYAGRSQGFINAILRRATQEGIQLPEGHDSEALSVRYSHPLPLVCWLQDQFGYEKALQILKENNEAPPLCLRTNVLKTTREALIVRLGEEGILAQNGAMSNVAVVAEGGGIRQTEAYAEGLFTIQDQSAQLVALALRPLPGQRVYDVCAAPGGKTTHLAELMEDKGQIMALDIYEKRLQSVEQAARRLGLSIITTYSDDARTFTANEKADKILVDAPCSGLGVVRRRPDIKYKEGLLDFSELVDTQLAILRRCGTMLKSGGELVYSTCTINPSENEGVIQAFLSENPAFSLMPISGEGMGEQAKAILKKGMGTFYPDKHEGDGFFIAKLKKE